MHFLDVQTPMAYQFSGEQQHRNLVAIAGFRGRIGIDVENLDGMSCGGRQCGELQVQLLAQVAAGA